MMDPDTRRQRHAALWASGTAGARRFAIAGIILAILVLLRVVEPYHKMDGERAQEIKDLEKEQQELALEEAQLPRIEQALLEVQSTLEMKPWNVEIERLKAYFVELYSGSNPGRLPVPQDRANETIERIDNIVKTQVIEKLRTVMSEPNTPERLADYPNTLEKALKDWYDSQHGQTDWYITPQAKEDTVEGMEEVLDQLKTQALVAVTASKDDIAAKRTEIAEDINDIDEEIADLKKEIKADLNEILPTWARNTIGVDSMVKLYPWLLLVIAAMLVVKGWTAAKHFHSMADLEGWTKAERSDPLISTPWTLTWRGYWGTAATVANYAAVTLVLLFCLHRAAFPPPYEEPEQTTEATSEAAEQQTAIESSVQELAETVSATVPVEVIYALMIALLAGLLGVPAFRAVSEFQQD